MNQQANNPNLSCSLSGPQLAERRAAIRSRILANTKSVTNTANGYRLSFAVDANIKADIEEFIALEEQCCGFLRFSLIAPAEIDQEAGRSESGADGEIIVEVSGPDGTRQILEELMGQNLKEDAGDDLGSTQ